ncbi:MAG: MarR family transcriptional regulator [Actinobacteria bacterium]|nr:MarR family transcriptional regulator [Actinomycetota bacterium]
MPSKSHNTRTNTDSRALQAPPDATPATAGRTGAEDKLWATLHAHPATATASLAVLAGIGRSTAGKILTTWAAEGCVARTSGSDQGGRRGADTWTICDTIADNSTEPTVNQRPDLVVTDEPVHDTASGTADYAGGEVAGPTDHNEADQPPGFHGTPGTGDEGQEPAKAPRLGKGALRGMVEDYLAEHTGEQFSPSAIGKALNRSSGAVNNALEKLVAAEYAVQTQDKPKRFTAKATAPESTAR